MNKKGFMLLEVLLSIVILSTSVICIIGSMAASLKAWDFLAHYLQVVASLDNQMNNILSGDHFKENNEPDEFDKTIDFLSKGKDPAEEVFNIYRIKLSFSERLRKKRTNIFLETYIFDFNDELYRKEKE